MGTVRQVGLLLSVLILSAAGCYAPAARSAKQGRHTGYRSGKPVIKPVLAVTEFENRANYSGQWNLGQGMADLLITELLEDGRVVVLERENLGDVVGEIVRQGQNLFRQEGRVARGRLQNAKYLVRGVLTDFTITSESSGRFAMSRFRIGGRRMTARVAINVAVSDVESGEIISSVKADATVPAGGFGGEANYKGVAFGGDTFFRTPLGRATETAIGRAVKDIMRDMPSEKWRPMVAEVAHDLVVVNGGENARLRGGEVFAVRERGRRVTDPATGAVLEVLPGREIGRIEVQKVTPLTAHAVLLEGKAQRGDLLERIPEE